MNPAIGKNQSSNTPKLIAALIPKSDQAKGITNRLKGNFLILSRKIPKVNMVVGQGRPNVGATGYVCPPAIPNNGYMKSE